MKNLKQLLMKKAEYEIMKQNIRTMKSSDELGENNKSISQNRRNEQN